MVRPDNIVNLSAWKNYTMSFKCLLSTLVIRYYCRHDFSEDQRTCLEEIEIGMLFSLIKYFCTWIKEGYCDFWDINLYFKNPLDHKDDEILKNIIYTEHYKGIS